MIYTERYFSVCSLFLFNTIIPQVFQTNMMNNTGFLYDFRDGTIYKNHPLFCVDPHALQIIIYYDDVEPANPLGSSKGRHKLGTQFLIFDSM